jgi:hypothetical protein
MDADEALIEAWDLGMDDAGYSDAVIDRAEDLLPTLIAAGYAATDNAAATWWFTDKGVAQAKKLEADREAAADPTPNHEVWTGLVEVVAEEGNNIFEGALGAYANVLALASSAEEYMAVTAPALLREGLIAVGVENPEPLRERSSREALTAEFLGLGERASKGDVVWDTFYTFEAQDDQG